MKRRRFLSAMTAGFAFIAGLLLTGRTVKSAGLDFDTTKFVVGTGTGALKLGNDGITWHMYPEYVRQYQESLGSGVQLHPVGQGDVALIIPLPRGSKFSLQAMQRLSVHEDPAALIEQALSDGRRPIGLPVGGV